MSREAKLDGAALSRLLGPWAHGDETLSGALGRGIGELIDTNLIPTGTVLPPERELAGALHVSRGTVTSAMDALRAQGYISSVRGSGTRVTRGLRGPRTGEGRMVSFTDVPPGVVDLSTGALPASSVTAEVLKAGPPSLSEFLGSDGYFPAGLPMLREALADRLTADGVPTRASQILITSGAQQGTWLALSDLMEAGDLAVVEEPTYRGGLAVLRSLGTRIDTVPFTGTGMAVPLVASALRRRPAVLYCQTSVHNPTGRTTSANARRALAELVDRHGQMTVEDVCSYDLTLRGPPARMLAGSVDEALLVTVGTLSKQFWGGIRVGWIRAHEHRIKRLTERRTSSDLASSVIDQLYATQCMARIGDARLERQRTLNDHVVTTESVVRDVFPDWRWDPIDGGAGLWVDTGTDATALAELGKRKKVKIVAGPGFSAFDGFASMLRLPIWHPEDQLRNGLQRLADAVAAA